MIPVLAAFWTVWRTAGRPDTGDTTRPNTGVTARPNSGTTQRP